MRVAIIQFDIEWGKPLVNIHRVEKLISQNDKADLYVLPEMWSTGFDVSSSDMIEEEQSSVSFNWMKQFSRENKCAVCGSLAIKVSDGNCYNRNYFVTPDNIFYYDKHHLFTLGGENKFFSRGHEHTIVEWKGLRFLLQTCYDLRFPIWSRYGVAGEYDIIIYVANWPSARKQAWDILTKARAIENQCYVIAVNRVGEDDTCTYEGGSVIVDPLGNELANVVANGNELKNNTAESVVITDLCSENLNKLRAKFNVLNDRDSF